MGQHTITRAVRLAAAGSMLAAGLLLCRAGLPLRSPRMPGALALCLLALGLYALAQRRIEGERACAVRERVARERDAERRVCVAAIESLAYAVEARTSTNLGHLARVQSGAVATARAMGLETEEIQGIQVAALVHEIGRLGVPDNLLGKEGLLTEEERERVRAYPMLGGRLLATVPFPWPVAALVRHHREHFDGSGYPDGLCGEAIPLGARILAVADAYDTLVSARGSRPGLRHEEALIELERAAGSQFDPAVMAAFRSIAEEARSLPARREAETACGSAACEIARAQREVQALYELACSVGATLCLSDTLEIVMRKTCAIIPCASCVLFLREDDGENLRAHAAFGVNHWHFRRSRARLGTYLTGRAAWRGEVTLAAYMPDDLQLHRTAEPWTPLRSTLIVPLLAEGQVIGTINLYHTLSDAFQPDDARIMGLIGELAGRAIHNARLFEETQETAFTDALTGLRNRRYLRHYLDQELNRARKNRHSLALLGMDLDGFKTINDTYGHDRGDEVLREVAQVFQANIRNYDLAARYAGDEFAIVLPETNGDEARVVAAKIRAAVERYAQQRRHFDPDFPGLGVSIGAAVYPEDGMEIQALITCADQRMYADKRAHKAA